MWFIYRIFVICEAFYSFTKMRVLYRDSPKNFRSEKFLKSAVVCTRGINKIFNKIRAAWIQPLIGDDTNTGIEEETYPWLYTIEICLHWIHTFPAYKIYELNPAVQIGIVVKIFRTIRDRLRRCPLFNFYLTYNINFRVLKILNREIIQYLEIFAMIVAEFRARLEFFPKRQVKV